MLKQKIVDIVDNFNKWTCFKNIIHKCFYILESFQNAKNKTERSR